MIKIITLLLLFLSFSISSYSQYTEGDISIFVQVAPPYSPNIHDYDSYLNQSVMNITNNTGVDINLRFVITLTNLSTGIYFKSKMDVPADPYLSSPGVNAPITGSAGLNHYASSNIDDYETNVSSVEKANIALSGILPEGNYQFCIQAFNYDEPSYALSSPLMGCAIIPISNVQPPIIIQPMCGSEVQALNPQQLLINWMPPIGNIAGGMIQYDLYMVNVPEGLNPFDVMDGFVSVGTSAGGFAFHKTQLSDNHFNYNTEYNPLDEGVYAIQIKASDPTGILNFANGGLSPVCSFVYKKTSIIIVDVVDIPTTTVSCESCKTALPVGAVNFSNLTVESTLKFGNQNIKVKSVNIAGDKASGVGILTFLNIPVRIEFSNVTVNQDNEVLSGQAQGIQRPGISFLPTVPSPDLSPMPMTSDQITYVDKFVEDNATHLVSNLETAVNAIGFDFPIGLDENILGVNTVIAIVGLHLTPTSGAFDAATVIDIPEAGLKVPLGARNICIKPNGVCGDGQLFLLEDLNIPSLNLKLKAFNGFSDKGTHIDFKDFGFDMLRIKAEYTFSQELIISKNNPTQPVTLTMIGEGKSWSDWKASVTFDPFVVKGIEDLSFALDQPATYDHSSISNPIGLPSSVSMSNDWNGFFMPKMIVSLPSVIHKVNSTEPVTFSATNVVIDNEGFTGKLNAEPVLSIGEGSLDSWYFSIDKIYASIVKNSFSDAGMDGKVILPICSNKNQNELNYHSTLTSTAGKLGFQFVIQPKNNIEVPLWYSQFSLYNTSNITIAYNGTDFKASTDLSGKMDIVADIDVIKVTYKLMEFQHLKLMSYEPYYSIGSFTGGFASPQKDVSGFDVTLDKFKLVSKGGLVGPYFEMGVNLADLGALPKASAGFSILGKPELKNGRPDWHFEKLDLSKVSVDGDLGPAKIKGELEFYENDPTFQDGIRGELEMTVIGALTVKSQALFGHKNDYNYFYIDANVKMETGIPITTLPAPPISVFGMGAGLYYHLEPEKVSNNPLDLLKAPTGLANKYKPNPSTFGFLGNIVMGMSDGSSLQGICGIDVTASLAGGNFSLQNIRFDGSFYMMCPLGDLEKSVGKGVGVMNYDFANDIFDLNCVYYVKAEIGGFVLKSVVATLSVHVDANSGDWHLKVGEPNHPVEIYPFDVFPPPFTPLNYLITGTGYFMMGNTIGNAIALNDDVRKALGITAIKDQKRNTNGLNMGTAVTFGAGLSLPKIDETFLCFYMKFNAGIGFDFLLARQTDECAGSIPGFNGYYANGQFYAYLMAEFGLDVDLWFYTGRVCAGGFSVAAAFQAGMPNPMWFEGYASAGFNILGGLVKGNMNFHLKVGEKCKAEKQPFGDGLPIISEIKPGTINSATIKDGVEVDQIVELAFNYPIDQSFTITDTDDDGKSIDRTYRIEIEYLNIIDQTTNGVVLSMSNNRTITWGDEHKTMMLYPKVSYTPHANHYVEVQVKVLEWNKVTYRFEQTRYKNVDVKETANASFKTAGCPTTLAGRVLSTYPFASQRFLLQEENGRKGHIDLPVEYNCMNDPAYDLVIEFDVYQDHSLVETKEVPASVVGNQVLFSIPVLPNSALIHANIIKRLKPVSTSDMMSSNSFIQFTNIQLLKNISGNTSEVYMIKASVEGKKRASTNIRLFDYYFQTSEYNNLAQKLNGMTSTAKNYTFNNPTALVQSMEFSYASHEGFDVYDLNGQISSWGDANYYSPAVIDIREADVNEGWRNDFVKSYFKDYFDLKYSGQKPQVGPFHMEIELPDLGLYDSQGYYGNNITNCFLNPITVSDRFKPLPYLSLKDISDLLPPCMICDMDAVSIVPFH